MGRTFLVVLIYALGGTLVAGEPSVRNSGLVQNVMGELVYVTGLNMVASVGSQLRVDNESSGDSTSLKVIKELDDVLVTQIVEASGSGVKVSDRVRLVGTHSSDQSLRTAYAVRIDRGPKMDGILNDAVWRQAQPIEGFIQRDPGYWIPMTERTVARILYDDKQIYFGFE